MKKRSGFQVMLRLVGLVRPLAGFMALAILLGLVGHLCAAFLTVLGGYALAGALGLEIPFSLGLLFGGVLVFAVARGFLRYGEQACNHFIAFKLLALLREKVFQALRRLCPAKLEGKDRGNLIALITSDIELLEVFYAHTLSPIAIAALFTVALCLYIGSFHWALGLLALAAYAVVGVAVPLVTSRLSGDDGLRFRAALGGTLQLCAGQPAGPIGNAAIRPGPAPPGGDGRPHGSPLPGRGADEAHRRPQPGGDEHRHLGV